MDVSLGLRVAKGEVHWAVVVGSLETPALKALDKLVLPASFEFANTLSWCRDQVFHLIDTYKPNAVVVRVPEAIARTNDESSRQRLRIEGVIIEAASSRRIDVQMTALVGISKRMGLGSAKVAKEVLGNAEYRGLQWKKYGPNPREAILVAASGLR